MSPPSWHGCTAGHHHLSAPPCCFFTSRWVMMIVRMWDEGCRVAHSADPATWLVCRAGRMGGNHEQLNATIDISVGMYGY